MPFDLDLPKALKKSGWKVKIHDLERLEPPHITIYRKLRKWRLSLRTGKFLDLGDKWSQLAKGVRDAIETNWTTLRAEWDRLFPDNPVQGEEDDDGSQ